MIPLGTWLESDDGDQVVMEKPPECASETSVSLADLEPERLEQAYLRGRSEALADVEVRVELAVAQAKAETELEANERIRLLTMNMGTDFARAMQSAFEEMRLAVEASLAIVLRPFLDERIVARGNQALAELIQMEIARSSEPLLDVRAPENIARALGEALADQLLAVEVSTGTTVDVRFRSHASRFETLASKWRQSLEEGGDVG